MIEWNGKEDLEIAHMNLMQREKFDFILVARTDKGLEIYVSSPDPVINEGLLHLALNQQRVREEEMFKSRNIPDLINSPEDSPADRKVN